MSRRRTLRSRQRRSPRPFLRRRLMGEALEPRLVLAAVSWNTDADGDWDVPENWLDQQTLLPRVPGPSDEVVIDRPGANPVVSITTGTHSVRSIRVADTLVVSGGVLDVSQGTQIDVGGMLDLQGDFTLGGNGVITNEGTFRKSAGPGESLIDKHFHIRGGTVEVQAGTLSLARGGTSTGGTLNAAVDAVLSLKGTTSFEMNGTYTGSGGGRVEFSGSSLFVHEPGMTANFSAGLFHWTAGSISPASNRPFTNLGSLTLSGNGNRHISGNDFFNAGTIVMTDAGTVTGGAITNQVGATFDFQGDGDLTSGSFFNNLGTVKKSGGTGESRIDWEFRQANGTISAESGRLTLGGGGVRDGGALNAALGAVLDLTGGSNSPAYKGTFTGTGDGRVELASGTLHTDTPGLTFDFSAGLFHWTGGTISGHSSRPLTNEGSITISGDNAKQLNVPLNNVGSLVLRGAGSLGIFDCCGFGIDIQNGATFDIQSDADTTGGFINVLVGSLLKKSGGAGGTEESRLASRVNILGGTVEVTTGKLTLAGGAASTGGTLNVLTGATLDLTGGTEGVTYGGTYTGEGGGQIVISGGRLDTPGTGAMFNLPANMLHWTGGMIHGPGTGFVNTGFLTLAGAANKVLVGRLANDGTIKHTDDGDLLLNGSSLVANNAGAIYDFAGDSDFGPSGGGAGFHPFFQNDGTIRKSAGTGATTEFTLPINTTPTAVFDVQVGRLKIHAGGMMRGGTWNAAEGAVLEISDGAALNDRFTGSGGGRVEFSGGRLGSFDLGIASGAHATLDFPEGLFRWVGGSIASSGCNSAAGCATTLVNAGSITIEGPNPKGIGDSGLINQGTVVNLGPGDFGISSSVFDNRQGAVYEHRGDSNFFGTDQFGNPGRFINAGTFRKTAGAGAVDVSSQIENKASGVIEVQSGRLKFSRGGGSTGGTFNMAAGATLEFGCRATGPCEIFNWAGQFRGTGPGRIEFLSLLNGFDGSNPAQLDFPPGVFRMLGGQLLGAIVNENTFEFAPSGGLFTRAGITNNGTWIHSGTGDFVLNANSRFINHGLYDLRTDADFVSPNDGSFGTVLFVNTGTFRKSDGLGTSNFRHNGGGRAVQMDNTGTVEVQSGTLSFDDGATQFNGATLTAGEWIVRPFAALAAPNATNFTTNRARVTLDGPNSTFARFNTLNNNQGSFTLAGGRDFTTVGNLINSGQLHVGPGSVLTVNGTLTETVVNNLVAWWRGEGDATDSADATPINGTLNGDTTFAAGQFGQAFSFDGDGDFVSLGNPAELRLQEFTISAWVKRDNLADTGVIFGYGQNGYALGMFGDGKLFLTRVGVDHVQTTNLRVADTEYHHVAVTKSGNTVTFYVDGAAETVGGYTTSFSFGSNAAIGSVAANPTAPNSFHGRIDEVAVFNRPLHAAEVAALRHHNDPIAVGNPPPEIRIEIAGRPRSGQFGRIDARGAATLAGRLNIIRSSGFGPTADDTYRVMNFASRTGNFTEVLGVDPFFTLAVNPTNVSLNAQPDVPTFDLDVVDVIAPPAGSPGAAVTIEYSVRNLSDHDLGGTWIDSLYLSRDITYSPDDLLIGRVEHRGGVLSQATYSETLTATWPAAIDGDYHVIVLADSRNSVPDPDRDNNRQASANLVSLAVPSLQLGVAVNGQVRNGQDLFFRLDAAAGQDLVLAATFAAQNQAEFYVSYRRLPTRSDFDFVANDPAQLARSIALEGPQAGPYYVLIHGREGAATGTAFTLLADQPDLVIEKVAPARGSNRGAVTLTLTGTGLSPTAEVSLVGPTTTRNASDVKAADSHTAFALFNLVGLPVGSYAIRVRDQGREVTLPEAFEVVTGNLGRVETRISPPALIRAGRQGTVYIHYENTGDTDVTAPLMIFASDHARYKLPEQADFTTGPLPLLAINPRGPAGVLPPGASGVIPVQVQPTSGVIGEFDLILPGFNDPINWNAYKESLRPAWIAPDAWEAIFANYVGIVGNTMGQYQLVLNGAATLMSDLGTATHDVYRLQQYLFHVADGFGAISSRYRLGSWGRGYADQTTNVATTDAAGNVIVSYGGVLRFFERLANGTYRGAPSDPGVLNRLGDGYELREVTGGRTVFRADGKLEFIEDTYGHRTTLTYDAQGRLAVVTDFLGDRLTYAYNAAGRVISITDEVGRVTTYTYDAAHEHLLSVSDEQGTESYTYITGQGAAREHALASKTFADGTRVFYEYDSQGRVIRETRDGGAEPVVFNYDELGIVKVTLPNGAVVRTAFDERGRAVRQTDPLGHVTRLAWNALSQPTRLVDAAGQTYTMSFDARSNVLSIVDPLGQQLGFDYDPRFNLTRTVRDPAGNLLQLNHDARGNVVEVIYADGSSDRFGYDADGNRTQHTSRSGKLTEFTYDANQMLATATADGQQQTYTYDAHRNLTSVTSAAGTINLEHDDADRLIRITYPNGRFIAYQYDAHGRRSRIETHDGFIQNYSYDALGRLARVTDAANQPVVSYTYDAAGQLAREDKANGTATIYSYDLAGRVIAIEHLAAGGAAQQLTYQYDAHGRVIRATSAEGATDYGYDATGQLTSVRLPTGRIVRYEYDAAGNRIRSVDDGLVVGYGVNNLNQVTQAGTATFTYDMDGNLISRVDAAGMTTYEYDVRNQLVRVVSPAGVWEYEYDALGNRSALIHDGQRTEFLVDPTALAVVLGEYDDAGQLVAHYSWGYGLTSRNGMGGVSFFDYDVTGSTWSLTDAAGAVVQQYGYLPFGELLTDSGGAPNAYTFHGRWGVAREGHGLYFMRNRFYDADHGRFTQPDPLRTQGGDFNLYRFVRNDPVNAVDPSGLNESGIQVNGAGDYRPSPGFDYRSRPDVRASTPTTNARPEFRHDPLRLAREALAREQAEIAAMNARARANPRPPVPELEVNNPRTPTNPVSPTNPPPARPAPAAPTPPSPRVPPYGSFAERFGTTAVRGSVFAIADAASDPNLIEYAWYSNEPTDGSPFGDAAQNHPEVRDAREQAYEDQRQRATIGVECSLLSSLLATAGTAALIPATAAIAAAAPPAIPFILVAGGLAFIEAAVIAALAERLCWGISYIAPSDPNDIVGPPGFGPQRFISADHVLPYTIRFENKPSATAPAQEVFVTHQLDSDLDAASLEFGDISFGDHVIPVPPGRNSFQTVFDARDSLNAFVEITASVNVTTGLVTWVFRTLDPESGDLPSEPLAGFLPPNQPPPIGEGSLNFLVRRKPTAGSGTRIDAQATIVFDTEPPLDTPAIFNTLDAGTPTSSVAPLPAKTYARQLTINWSGTDEANGSGIGSYDVFISTDGGPFEPLLIRTTTTFAVVDRPRGHTYAFYSVARDNVGHVEFPPANPDTQTLFVGPPWHNTRNPLDVNDDGSVSPLDVLLNINLLNAVGSHLLPIPPGESAPPPYHDVNDDGFVSPIDVLLVINFLINPGGGEGEGEARVLPGFPSGAARLVSASREAAQLASSSEATAAATLAWDFWCDDFERPRLPLDNTFSSARDGAARLAWDEDLTSCLTENWDGLLHELASDPWRRS